jgi:Cu(I)/Ag(I) efflux system membrane fusion protein
MIRQLALLLALLGVVLVAVFVGRVSTEWWPSSSDNDHAESASAVEGEETLWTCPMHPEVVLPSNVPCPKCGMDLVPKVPGDDPGPNRIKLTAEAAELARIETQPVRRSFATMPVRMVGKIDFDETRVRSVAARVAGRLDRLYVDYTGIAVQEKDHLVSLYSPDLLVAQQELLQAKKRVVETSPSTSDFLKASNERSYRAAREKLVLWGLTEAQVDEIEARGAAEDHMLIRSPVSGVVIDKHKDEGDYVNEGTAVYRIADLSKVWVQLAAYEQDLPWLRYGQSVTLFAEALPGEPFDGRISFLAPVVDEKTRTVAVRVDVDNAGARLKPGMFVRGVVRSRIGDGGTVLDARLAGKWISPMHPEVVKDGPGTCDVCGMDLVPAEKLGYAVGDETPKPLLVPATAVLVTGKRGVVYVQVQKGDTRIYEGREVVLGPRAGDDYIVRSGVRENELVVVNGAFRLDSAMQIQAKPSMMSQAGEAERWTGSETAVFRSTLGAIYESYLGVAKALGDDDFEAARAQLASLVAALPGVDDAALAGLARERWQDERASLETALAAMQRAGDIATMRAAFEALARDVLALERMFGHDGEAVWIEAYCPMAFDDKGAAWLQPKGTIHNPYFGAAMLVCGEARREFLPVAGSEGAEPTEGGK